MKYYRDVDYFLYFEDFPHMGVPGVTALNSDGTVNIFINTLYNLSVQARTIRHELRHFAYGHFSADWMTITEKEVEADNDDDPNCIFDDEFAWVEYTGKERLSPFFASLIPREDVIDEIEHIYKSQGILHMSFDIPNSPYISKTEAQRIYKDAQTACDIVMSDYIPRHRKTVRVSKTPGGKRKII